MTALNRALNTTLVAVLVMYSARGDVNNVGVPLFKSVRDVGCLLRLVNIYHQKHVSITGMLA